MAAMAVIFFLLFLVALVALIVGLISPKAVVRWGTEDKRTRGRAGMIYGFSMLVLLIAFFVRVGVFQPGSSTLQPSVPAATAPAVVTPTPAPAASAPVPAPAAATPVPAPAASAPVPAPAVVTPAPAPAASAPVPAPAVVASYIPAILVYSDSAYSQPWSPTTKNKEAYIECSGLTPNAQYALVYYDGKGKLVATDTGFQANNDGIFQAVFPFSNYNPDQSGEWKVVLLNGQGTSITDTIFYVNSVSIPEFPTWFAGILVMGICAGRYIWLRKRYVGRLSKNMNLPSL